MPGRPGGSEMACVDRGGAACGSSFCIPVCEGLACGGLTLAVAVHLRKLHLVHEPLARFEGVVRRLPWRAADSSRTFGVFAVEETCEALGRRWWLGSTGERDAAWSSDRAAGAGLDGPRPPAAGEP